MIFISKNIRNSYSKMGYYPDNNEFILFGTSYFYTSIRDNYCEYIPFYTTYIDVIKRSVAYVENMTLIRFTKVLTRLCDNLASMISFTKHVLDNASIEKEKQRKAYRYKQFEKDRWRK